MGWFHERREVASERNERIVCERWFGRWNVSVGGLDQTSGFVIGLWRKALRRIPRHRRKQRILMLGLGTGGVLQLLGRRFPHCSVVVVEWDPVMVQLMKEFAPVTDGSNIEIVCADARSAIGSLNGKFDLVVCDLFVGKELSSLYRDAGFIDALRSVTSDSGWLVVNGYNHPEIFSCFKDSFFQRKRFKVITNWFAVFRPAHAGSIGEAPDEGFRRAWSSLDYLHREIDGRAGMEVVLRGGAAGIRQKIGPIVLDTFRATEEPQDDGKETGFALWQPISTPTSAKGWWRIPLFFDRRRTGYLRFPEDADFHRRSESAMRKLRTAEKEGTEVVSISCEAYLEGIIDADLPPSLIKCFTTDVRRKHERHGDLLHCFAVLDESGKVVAGLAVLDVPELSLSLHVSAFMRKEMDNPSAGVALIARWMLRSTDRGFDFLDFDALWRPGEARSWRGFGRFKEQFGLRKIDYCWPRIKLMRRRKTSLDA